MADKSKIEWTDATWSPVTGCDPISPGCKNCYAKREVEQRWSKNPKSVFFGRAFNDVQCHADALEQPLRWKKGRRIFVCPRADLFHEAVPDAFLDRVFAVMAQAPQHTFQVLTKRAARMQAYLSDENRLQSWADADIPLVSRRYGDYPLPNVHVGVSVESNEHLHRVVDLIRTPAAVRWVSAEPLLGPIDIPPELLLTFDKVVAAPRLDWVVVGGESGPKARPMHPDWVRELRDCSDIADMPFLFKQWGEWYPAELLPNETALRAEQWAKVPDQGGPYVTRADEPFPATVPGHAVMGRIGIRKTGRLLDGALHDGYPEVRP
jgi:protein gp37